LFADVILAQFAEFLWNCEAVQKAQLDTRNVCLFRKLVLLDGANSAPFNHKYSQNSPNFQPEGRCIPRQSQCLIQVFADR
jgi:hypothetical protein